MAHYMLANGREGTEAVKKAREFSLKATELERLLIEAQYASVVENDREKRLRILQEAAEKYPKDKEVHTYLAMAYSSRGAHEQSIDEYNKVLALDPNNPDALNMIAYEHMGIKDFDKAVEYLKDTWPFCPDNPTRSIPWPKRISGWASWMRP